ncbi:MAG: hypothetical protein R3B49_10865 [Phycisphaerales bacterium]
MAGKTRLGWTLAAFAGMACAGGAMAQTAADYADDSAYGFDWSNGSNGGFGFGSWVFRTDSENGDGFAGMQMEYEPSDGLSNVGTNGQAWDIYANTGTGVEEATAFRGLSQAIAVGESFSVSFEHGGIADGGVVGVALRNGNTDATASDYDSGARTQFYFQGGTSSYSALDGSGLLDTGAGFTFDGVRATFTLRTADTYDLELMRYTSEAETAECYTFRGRTLAGSGTIDSLALFSNDGGAMDGLNNDAYFNSLVVETAPALAATGTDTADDPAYANGWADCTDGGAGFDPWNFRGTTENSDGFAGRFMADENTDGASNVLNQDPGKAWALYANNGSGQEVAAAFRGLEVPIAGAGRTLSITFENGGVATGGLVGVALRTGNDFSDASDYATGARSMFYFQGGDSNYSVVDGAGLLATPAGFTFDGVTVKFIFTGADTYDMEVTRYYDELGGSDTYTVTGRTLAGSGAIESIAIFSDDGGASDNLNNDVYFNNLVLGEFSACSCDINGDGTLNLDDVNLFATGFIGGDLGVDQDGNGTLNLDDVNLFASCFIAGCP